MQTSPTTALDELDLAIAGEGPLDVPACQRLALRVVRQVDGEAAAYLHESLCSAIDAHGEDPARARRQIELLRPAIEILINRQ